MLWVQIGLSEATRGCSLSYWLLVGNKEINPYILLIRCIYIYILLIVSREYGNMILVMAPLTACLGPFHCLVGGESEGPTGALFLFFPRLCFFSSAKLLRYNSTSFLEFHTEPGCAAVQDKFPLHASCKLLPGALGKIFKGHPVIVTMEAHHSLETNTKCASVFVLRLLWRGWH